MFGFMRKKKAIFIFCRHMSCTHVGEERGIFMDTTTSYDTKEELMRMVKEHWNDYKDIWDNVGIVYGVKQDDAIILGIIRHEVK